MGQDLSDNSKFATQEHLNIERERLAHLHKKAIDYSLGYYNNIYCYVAVPDLNIN